MNSQYNNPNINHTTLTKHTIENKHNFDFDNVELICRL